MPWLTKGLLTSRKTKNKLYAKNHKNHSPANLLKYKNYKNVYNKLCRTAKNNYTREAYNAAKNNTKSLWQLINGSVGRKTKKGLNIPNFFTKNGVIFDNYRDISEGFNDFFINIGQKLQDTLPYTSKST